MSFLSRPLTPLEHDYLDAAQRGDQAETARLEAMIDAEDAETVRRLTQPGVLGAAAVWYADTLGWPVFPLVPGEKRPATPHGFKDATTALNQIESWWRAVPDANIGLPTGDRFDVIDIDRATAITAALQGGILPDWDGTHGGLLATVMTPRGWHLYVPPTGIGSGADMIPGIAGIDYRGAGGYVVAPPSRVGGRLYRWDAAPDLTGAPAGQGDTAGAGA